MYVNRFALFRRHPVRYIGYGGDDVHVEFAVEALLDDFHVEQAEEAAAETESEGEGAFRVERERGVVELELLQRGAQVFVLVGLHGIDAREDHRFHILETGYRFGAGVFYVGYRIAHLHLAGVLDARYDVAHVTRPDFLPGGEFQFQNADFIGVVFVTRVDELHRIARAERPVEDAEVGDDAAEGVEYRIENKRLQGSLLVAFRGGNALHDGFEYFVHPLARAARCGDDFLVAAPQQVGYLVLDLFDHGSLHVYLVDDGDDFEVVSESEIEIGDGLCLYPLRGIHDKQRPFARGDGTGYLIGEVHMAGRVDEVEDVFLAAALVLHLDGVALYRDALFAFQLHVIEYLRLQVALRYGVGRFEQPVGNGAFAVVYMGYDAEVPDVLHESDIGV